MPKIGLEGPAYATREAVLLRRDGKSQTNQQLIELTLCTVPIHWLGSGAVEVGRWAWYLRLLCAQQRRPADDGQFNA
jgi:hypothetical protein